MGSAGSFPGLGMGITVANRQSSGKTPVIACVTKQHIDQRCENVKHQGS